MRIVKGVDVLLSLFVRTAYKKGRNKFVGFGRDEEIRGAHRMEHLYCRLVAG